jgi:uncharacterized membrane protein
MMLEDARHLQIAIAALEYAGIAAIILGALYAVSLFGIALFSSAHDQPFRAMRARLGRSILLGLEFLVAADIIATVAIEPTLQKVATLGALILVRTFLSLSLEVEIEGRWPWQRARAEAEHPLKR